MSKSVSSIESIEYRKAPASAVENIIGGLSVLAIIMAVVFAAMGEVLTGGLMFIGAVVTYVALVLARNGR